MVTPQSQNVHKLPQNGLVSSLEDGLFLCAL